MKDGSSGAEPRERLRMCKEVEISIEMKMGKRMWTWRDTGQRMSDARNRTSCDPKLHAAPVPATLHRAFVATVVVCGTWKATRACTRQTARSTAVHWKVVERPSSPRLLIIPVLRPLFIGGRLRASGAGVNDPGTPEARAPEERRGAAMRVEHLGRCQQYGQGISA